MNDVAIRRPDTALILEDLPEVSDALADILRKLFPDIRIHAAASLAEAHVLLEDGLRFELALIDLALPDGSGIDLIRHMATAQPDCILVVASLYADDEYLFPALRAGAQGYLLKGEAPAKTAEALQGILRGEPPLSPAIAHRLLRAFRPCPIDPVSPMTPREREILGLVAKGHSVREVATRLSLSHHTVSDHLKRIYRKLNINSRAEAALEAARMGLTAVAP